MPENNNLELAEAEVSLSTTLNPITTVTEHTPEATPDSSTLCVSEVLVSRLTRMVSESTVARFLVTMLPKFTCSNADSSINYLSISEDDCTKLSYLNNARARSIQNCDGDLFNSNLRYHSSAGKVIRKILEETIVNHADEDFMTLLQSVVDSPRVLSNLSIFSERDIDNFTNVFRRQGFLDQPCTDIQIVRGEFIRDFYKESNYAPGNGQLSNSCMRYDRCQSYLDIYTRNPNICSMAIMLDSQDRLVTRAIIWTINEVSYFDRIYSNSDISSDRMKSYLMSQGMIHCFQSNLRLTIKHNLDKKDMSKYVNLYYDEYPYMDTFRYLSYERDILSTHDSEVTGDNPSHLILSDTAGSWEEISDNRQECAECFTQTDSDSLYHMELSGDEHRNESVCINCCRWSDHHETYISSGSSVYTAHDNDYIISNRSVRLHNSDYCHRDRAILLTSGDYAFEDDTEIRYIEMHDEYVLDNEQIVPYNSCYYYESDCLVTRDNIYVPIQYTIEHNEEIWEIRKLEEHQLLFVI